MDNRLFSGSVDGSLKVWDISDLKSESVQDPKSIPKSKTTHFERSNANSTLDDRQRRAQNMV